MTARDQVLKRLRTADEQERPLPPAPPPPAPGRSPVGLFIDRASAAGVEVVATAIAALPELVVATLRQSRIRRAAMWDDPLLEPVASAMRAAGIEVIPPGRHETDAADAGAGITTVDYAVAETGTLILACGPTRPRSTSLLPALHVAVLPADRILPSLAHLFSHLQALPPALTLITGPSRTADIELTPVLGAHGPTEVRVYVIEAS